MANAEDVEIDGIYYKLVLKAKIAEVTYPWMPGEGDGIGGYSGDVVIPESVEYNGDTYSVTTIGSQAFVRCRNLTSVSIPSSVTKIDYAAFRDCTSLAGLIIPSSVTTIGNEAFAGCLGFNSIVIPNSVISIGQSAFSSCSNMTSITIPESVTSIGDFAFNACSGLSSITIPNSVTSISYQMFSSCTGLKSITIPESVVNIDNYAFWGCSGLSSVSIPNSVISIGDNAFYGCSGLTSITIPNSVTNIGKESFSGCINLGSIRISSSVTNIGQKAFANCPEIADVYCNAEDVPYTYSDAFVDSYAEYATLHVHALSVEKYNKKSPWNNFMNILPFDKCATPSITFTDGELTFDCEVEDVEFISSVRVTGTMSGTGNKVNLTPTMAVSVYATKEYLENSDVATKEFDLSETKFDVNGDEEVNNEDLNCLIDILLGR